MKEQGTGIEEHVCAKCGEPLGDTVIVIEDDKLYHFECLYPDVEIPNVRKGGN